jgi:hypothetical protein
MDLGPVEFAAHEYSARLTIAGANPGVSPPFFQFGTDGVELALQ